MRFLFNIFFFQYKLLEAILPLRGKILNIERRDEAAMYKNEEIQNLILALGLGVKVSFYILLFGNFMFTCEKCQHSRKT